MRCASPRALTNVLLRSLVSSTRARPSVPMHRRLLSVVALVTVLAATGASGPISTALQPADLSPVSSTTAKAPAPLAMATWKSLSGRTVVLDPAARMGNQAGGKAGGKQAGGVQAQCDRVGGRTAGGVAEASITWKTARQLGKLLRRAGAQVVYTRNNRQGALGPCVDERAEVANTVGADLKIGIQADSSRPRNGGFFVAAPTDRAPYTDDIYEPSRKLATSARNALSARKVPTGRYKAGRDGLQFTSKLATLNLSDVPAVAVSLGNLANRSDARRMTTAKGQTVYAKALVKAARTYLNGGAPEAGNAALGVQVFSMWRDWEDHAELMDQVVAAGSSWIRVDVGWCSLEENGPGVISTWYQDRLDATVAAARARGLKLLITLACAPTWATPGNKPDVLPADPAQYARVASYLATRYRGQIAAWEVWNEPDCEGGCPRGNPEAYAQLLRAAYPALKAADPAAVVMNGGLSGIDLTWIRRMLDAGAAQSLDVLALHPYLAPAAAAPDTPSTAGFSNPYRITNVSAAHALLAEAGRPDVPIWFTEFGWTTGRTAGPYDGVSPQRQAAYLGEAMALVRKKYPYVQAAFWYMMRDRVDTTAYENGFGLLNADGSPKPAYAAFAKAAQG